MKNSKATPAVGRGTGGKRRIRWEEVEKERGEEEKEERRRGRREEK